MLLMNEIVPTMIPRIRIAEMLWRARKRKALIRKVNQSITIGDLRAIFSPTQTQTA